MSANTVVILTQAIRCAIGAAMAVNPSMLSAITSQSSANVSSAIASNTEDAVTSESVNANEKAGTDIVESEVVVNDAELEELAKLAKFVSIPDEVKIANKMCAVNAVLTDMDTLEHGYGETDKMSQFVASTRTITNGIVTDGDNILVTVSQHAPISEDNTCPYLGERLLMKTQSGKLVSARIAGLFAADSEVVDDSKSLYVKQGKDDATILEVWSDGNAQNPFSEDKIVAVANLGFDDIWSDFEAFVKTGDVMPVASDEYVGRMGVAKDLQTAGWIYKTDVVLGEDGDDADKVESLGIEVGDILADGTASDAPARVYLGADEDGQARWQRADKEGHIWELESWDDDMSRRSVWHPRSSISSTDNGASSSSFTGDSSMSAGTRKFIESCKKESDDWASGVNASQPWKYIDYWDKNVPEEYNPHSWGGQCSEYILWNLQNIGLIPGKTMADWDKIQWGGRAELKFLQDHPEYGVIHALDGKEDGCISGYYIPQPGDIAIHNHGDHFEMVSAVYDDHWEGYSSGSEGCGPVSHSLNLDTNADNHDGYYVFLTVNFDKALADSVPLA